MSPSSPLPEWTERLREADAWLERIDHLLEPNERFVLHMAAESVWHAPDKHHRLNRLREFHLEFVAPRLRGEDRPEPPALFDSLFDYFAPSVEAAVASAARAGATADRGPGRLTVNPA